MELLLVAFWGGVLAYLAITPKGKMEMTWLLVILLMVVTGVIAPFI